MAHESETIPRQQVGIALSSSKSAMLILLRPFCCGQSCCTDKNAALKLQRWYDLDS